MNAAPTRLANARLRSALTLIAAFAVPAVLHAQLPTNNAVWKTRCELLSSNASTIDPGTIPKILVAGTRGVPSKSFYALGINRSGEAQHYVACVMYYLAAIADRVGNGGKSDPAAATTDAVLGGAELKQALGQSLTMSEKMKYAGQKFAGVTTSYDLSATEAKAALDAATTLPLSLNPPPSPLPLKPTPRKTN